MTFVITESNVCIIYGPTNHHFAYNVSQDIAISHKCDGDGLEVVRGRPDLIIKCTTPLSESAAISVHVGYDEYWASW